MNDEAEAQRLASQRADDLASISERELKRAREQGRREALDELFRADTTAHFAVINGSIDKSAAAVAELASQVAQIKSDLRERDAVNVALIGAGAAHGAQKLTRFQSIVVVVMALIAFAALAVSVIQALG